jgi:hypothetical protein
MIYKLHQNLREPACSVNIVPSLMGNSLLSTVKMVEADYTAIYNKKEVNFYNSTATKIKVLVEAILKWWQCPRSKLWCVPWWTTSGMKTRTPSSLIIHTNMTV